jgi:hypothetical protein
MAASTFAILPARSPSGPSPASHCLENLVALLVDEAANNQRDGL